jgi:hypothetical protein
MLPVNVSILDPLIPILIMFVKQSGFPSKWNALLALAVYAIWTVVSLVLGLRGIDGVVTLEIALQAFVTAATTGYISYQLFYKGLTEQRIVAATSFVKQPISDEITGDVDPLAEPFADGATNSPNG